MIIAALLFFLSAMPLDKKTRMMAGAAAVVIAVAYNRGMKAVPHLSISAVCAALLVTLSVPAFAKPTDVSIWTPNLLLSSKLGPMTSLGAYSMRPPLGYRWGFPIYGCCHMNDPIWGGPVRPNHTNACLSITSGDTWETTTTAPDALLTSILSLDRMDTTKFVVTSVERGQVNGMAALRAKYWCQERSGTVLHGVNYVLKGKTSCFTARAIDEEPDNESALPMLEASILTARETGSTVPLPSNPTSSQTQ